MNVNLMNFCSKCNKTCIFHYQIAQSIEASTKQRRHKPFPIGRLDTQSGFGSAFAQINNFITILYTELFFLYN